MTWSKLTLATLVIACAGCSNTKQLQTQATESSMTRSIGQLDDVIRFSNLDESWIVPTERNGIVVNDTIRHRIFLNDTVRHQVRVNDTIKAQILSEQTKGKVKAKTKGLRESMLSVGDHTEVPSVALIISIGINVILIFVILSVYFLTKQKESRLT